jgi:hypothetical protein
LPGARVRGALRAPLRRAARVRAHTADTRTPRAQGFDVGSLRSALAAVPASPMFNTLASFNVALLKADSEAGQTLRRKALRGAIVVFFTAGYRRAQAQSTRARLHACVATCVRAAADAAATA